ncbi:MAG TPA: hypothetical protein VII80_07365, partial [Pseudolabrys sp.]|jgi:hypothetical protein
MAESKSAALPLGYAPTPAPEKAAPKHFFARGGRTIAAPPGPINGSGPSLYVRVLHLSPAGSL